MVKIFDALQKLKDDLDLINVTPLFRNSKGMADTSLSQKIFVNPQLLPQQFNTSKLNFASPEALEDYSKKALQALWNISDYTSGGYASALFNSRAIKDSAFFLDENRTPKIIDDKTYQAGLALQVFLREARTPAALNEIPAIGGVREKMADNTNELSNLLDKRLSVYEAHTPKKLTETAKWLRFKKAKLALLSDSMRQFDLEENNIDSTVNENYACLNSAVTANSPALENRLNLLEELLNRLQNASKQALDFCEQWRMDNLNDGVPDTVVSSDFIQALIAEPHTEELGTSWLALFNSDDSGVKSEFIKPALSTAYASAKETISKTQELLLLSMTMQKELFETRIADAKLLGLFEQAMEADVLSVVEVTAPDFVQALELDVDRSLLRDIAGYSGLIEQLNGYKKQLIEYKQNLLGQEANFINTHPVPNAIAPRHKAAFVAAVSSAKAQITTKIEKNKVKLDQVDILLHKAVRQLHHLQDDLAKSSAAGRQNTINNAQERIRGALSVINEQSVLDKRSESFQFLHSEYTPALAEMNNRINPQISLLEQQSRALNVDITQHNNQLTALTSADIERQQFLTKVREKLLGCKKILDAHKGGFLPVAFISKSELKAALECGEGSTADHLDGLYQKQEVATSWFGFNRTNFYDKYASYTNIFGSNTADYNLLAIRALIANKITYIDNELKINIKNNEVLASKPESLLGEGNCWNLQQEYQAVNQEKTFTEKQKEVCDSECKRLTQERVEQLAAWDVKLSEKLRDVVRVELDQDIATITHDIATLAFDSYTFEFQVADIEAVQNQLPRIIQELETKGTNEGLQYLVQMQEEIQKSNVAGLIDYKEAFGVPSCTELQGRIHDDLAAKDDKYNMMKSRLDDMAEPPELLLTRLEELKFELEELKEKSTRIDKSLALAKQMNIEHMQIIQNKKEVLMTLNQLAELQALFQTRYAGVMRGESLQAENAKARELILRDIESIQRTQSVFIEEVSRNKDHLVQEQYAVVASMAQKLENAYVALRVARIKEHSLKLINQFPAKTEVEQMKLLRNIEQFKQCELDFIDQIQNHDDIDVSAINSSVQQINHNTEQLRYPIDTVQHKTQDDKFYARIEKLRTDYFGDLSISSLGVFSSYLEERAQTFWFQDLFRNFAALTFGCFGYKAPAQARGDFLMETLQGSFLTYANGDGGDKAMYTNLLDIIAQGQKQFAPRAKKGGDAYSNSLLSKLESLKTSLEEIEFHRKSQPPAVVVSDSRPL
ncbi:MAG: hypothetical protein ACHP65_08855 [Legionellales bacterium]